MRDPLDIVSATARAEIYKALRHPPRGATLVKTRTGAYAALVVPSSHRSFGAVVRGLGAESPERLDALESVGRCVADVCLEVRADLRTRLMMDIDVLSQVYACWREELAGAPVLDYAGMAQALRDLGYEVRVGHVAGLILKSQLSGDLV